MEITTNKIYCIDCLDGMKKMKDDSVDLVVTDPPYFLPVNSYVGKRGQGYSKKHLADTSVLKGFFKQVIKELLRILKPEGHIYFFCDGQSYPIFYEIMFPHCKHVRPLIWDKKVSYNGYTWRHQHELICWGEQNKSERVPTGDGDVLSFRGVLQKNRNHPAEKPVDLLQKLISKHKSAEIVFDPFIGSGSVAIASIKESRKFIGFELNEEFFDSANKRILKAKQQILITKL